MKRNDGTMYLSLAEAAARLGLRPGTFRRLARRRKLRTRTMGRSLYVSVTEINALLGTSVGMAA